jgi:hypothetical protein
VVFLTAFLLPASGRHEQNQTVYQTQEPLKGASIHAEHVVTMSMSFRYVFLRFVFLSLSLHSEQRAQLRHDVYEYESERKM